MRRANDVNNKRQSVREPKVNRICKQEQYRRKGVMRCTLWSLSNLVESGSTSVLFCSPLIFWRLISTKERKYEGSWLYLQILLFSLPSGFGCAGALSLHCCGRPLVDNEITYKMSDWLSRHDCTRNSMLFVLQEDEKLAFWQFCLCPVQCELLIMNLHIVGTLLARFLPSLDMHAQVFMSLETLWSGFPCF